MVVVSPLQEKIIVGEKTNFQNKINPGGLIGIDRYLRSQTHLGVN